MDEDATSEQDIKRRTGLAGGPIQSLSSIWIFEEIDLSTKVKMYESQKLSVLLHNAETWTMKDVSKKT